MKWISIGDKLPSFNCNIIAHWDNGDVEQSAFIADWGKPHFQRKCGTNEGEINWGGNVGFVTHWMPLPKPPKGKVK